AIELAAVQLRTLTLPQLNSRLEHRFGLLTAGRRGALPHQQTLRATTRWSYDLCSAAEQLLWARLSVFAGSFDLAAPDAVCAGRAGEAARLAADLRAYWEISGLLREGKHWLTKILLQFPGPSPERAWLLLTRGVLGTLQGELGEAVADLELSTPMAQEHGEVLACALGHAYLCLAFVFSGRHAEAAATGAVAAERLQAIDHFSGLVSLDIHMGYLHLLSGELDAAIERCDQGLRRLGDSQERWASGYLQIITALALFFQ